MAENDMYFIGDTHGRVGDYFKLIDKLHMDCSIQLGDQAYGFPQVKWPDKWDLSHRWLFGNHDNPDLSIQHPNCLGKFGFLKEQDIYFISGAWSIDQKQRIAGLDWWANEELTYEDFDTIFREVKEYKPRIIIAHDFPSSVRGELFGFDKFFETKTGQALSRVFELHQPQYYLGGHYHRGKQAKINGTHFVCLQELECCEIPDIKWQK
jgi:hypothetical protein